MKKWLKGDRFIVNPNGDIVYVITHTDNEYAYGYYHVYTDITKDFVSIEVYENAKYVFQRVHRTIRYKRPRTDVVIYGRFKAI